MSKKVTITDIARLSETSKTTVSFYLNKKYEKMSDETRHRIESVIKKTGYRPSTIARSLNSKKQILLVSLLVTLQIPFPIKLLKE